MNALIKKEIRLLLPAWGMVIVLTALSARYIGSPMNLYAAFIGMVILAVASFGREIASGTFSNLLAQPANRSVIWWSKTSVLVTALATIAAGLWIGGRLGLPKAALNNGWLLLVSVPVAIAGGYWMVLLLRQVVAALWLAILMPTALCIGVLAIAGHCRVSDVTRVSAVLVSLFVYSVVGIWCSWRLYRRAQDVQWTGGTIAGRRWLFSCETNTLPTKIHRGYRPFVALFRKEIRLQQVTAAGMTGLFIVHLGVTLFRQHLHGAESYAWKDIEFGLSYFAFLWLLSPFFAAGAGVTEEYKPGIREGQHCLPLSERWQFASKLICTMLVGGLLPAVLLWSVEGFGYVYGVQHGVGRVIVESLFPLPGVPLGTNDFFGRLELNSDTCDVFSLAKLSAIFVGISAVAIFAASLSRNVLQTLLLGGLVSLAVCVGFGRLTHYPNGNALGVGPLVICFAIPLLLVTFSYLAYRNFRSWLDNTRNWFGSGFAISGVVALAGGLGSAVYHRVWEMLLPVTPVHGPAKLTMTTPPRFSYGSSTLCLLFSDGRLWMGSWSNYTDLLRPSAPIVLGRHEFVEGSNWVSVAGGGHTIAALRKDGTLWYAEARGRHSRSGLYRLSPVDETGFAMSQFGTDTDWSLVEHGELSFSFALLKRDGTLWILGPGGEMSAERYERYSQFWPGIRTFSPTRLGPNQKWAGMFSDDWGHLCLEDENGAVGMVSWLDARYDHTLFRIGAVPSWSASLVDESAQREFAPEQWIYRAYPQWASVPWKSVSGDLRFHLGVREDGTFWGWGQLPPAIDRTGPKWTSTPVRIGPETNWRAVQSCTGGCMLVKTDGTLWRWNYSLPADWDSWRRLDRNTDWVSLSRAGYGRVMALAADGGLWLWTPNEFERHNGVFGVIPPFELAPSLRPEFIGNIFSE